MARLIARYFQQNATHWQTPSPLQYILFFNEENILCALAIKPDSQPLILGTTDTDRLNKKLGCLPENRFSYFDQAHTLGVDLKQAPWAKALALIDHETTLEKAFQGFMQMRELEDDQTLEVMVPSAMASFSWDNLIQHMADNEARQLRQETFAAAQAKMMNCLREDFMQRLLAIPHDEVDKSSLCTRFSTLFH